MDVSMFEKIMFHVKHRKELNMTYQEAITAVKNGQTVRRTSWTNQNVTLVTDANGKQTITNHITRTVDAPYLATQEDMFATDWTT